MLCPKCNKDFDTRFCPSCGYSPDVSESAGTVTAVANSQSTTSRQPDNETAQPQAAYQPPPIIINNNNTASASATAVVAGNNGVPKHKWVAFFLCLLFGMFGVHRFYVGKVGTGILYLLTLGFLGIGIALDLFMILMGSFTDKRGNFLI
ncbi:MAG: TM2 domain-containing protein [Angelakisella sp.]